MATEAMEVFETQIPGALIVEPAVFGDERGFFLETWNQSRYRDLGLPGSFVQDNLSLSQRGVLRGLHMQNPNPQGKLVYVLQGEVFDVAVDLRMGSPAYGKWVGVTLSAATKRQFYVPPGCAHGFCVTSDAALFAYKCTDFYNPGGEISIAWDDPDLDIAWPVDRPALSAKDGRGVKLKELPPERLIRYDADA